MIEPKIILSMTVLGAGLVNIQEHYKGRNEGREKGKAHIAYPKSKGRAKKEVNNTTSIIIRKQKTIKHSLVLGYEAYKYMLSNPASAKYVKTWGTLSKDQKLRSHLDLIAHDHHAISYNYEVLEN